jgi:hypothetical protein
MNKTSVKCEKIPNHVARMQRDERGKRERMRQKSI